MALDEIKGLNLANKKPNNLTKDSKDKLLQIIECEDSVTLNKTRITKHIELVDEIRKALEDLGKKWENILFIAEMNSPTRAVNIMKILENIKESFSSLEDKLIENLANENINKLSQELSFDAQVLLDILIRNLFERTADIGFLATDKNICDLLLGERTGEEIASIKLRLKEYADKYTVYDEIIICDKEGNLVANLNDENKRIKLDGDTIKSLNESGDYMELFQKTSLINFKNNTPLLYGKKIIDPESEEEIGSLFLSFSFEDEMNRIFSKLEKNDDIKLRLLVDENGNVIASSDENQIPLKKHIKGLSKDKDFGTIRFAGKEYLFSCKATNGYEGYFGLGWRGRTMIPLDMAFIEEEKSKLSHIDSDILNGVMTYSSTFSKDLGEIANLADSVNNDLKRIIWNGQIISSISSDDMVNIDKISGLELDENTKKVVYDVFDKLRNTIFLMDKERFSKFKSVLEKISITGESTRELFTKSIDNLFETIISANLGELENSSKLAIDIMDRNLYERANDCRWWALTDDIRRVLSNEKVDTYEYKKINDILEYINSLYTVYTRIFVYDKNGNIVTSSVLDKNDTTHILGRSLDFDSGVFNSVLSQKTSQEYSVTPFTKTPLYNNMPTYVYHSGIRDINDSKKIVGGIGIVFDAAPQFQAILKSSLPQIEGSFGLFVDRNARIISSSTSSFLVCSNLQIDSKYLSIKNGTSLSDIIELNGKYYMMGVSASSGYREYKSENDTYKNDVISFIFSPIGKVPEEIVKVNKEILVHPKHTTNDTIEIASFYIDGKIYGIESSEIVEAVVAEGIAKIPGSKDLIGSIMYNYEGKEKAVFIIDVGTVLQSSTNFSNKFSIENKQIVILKYENAGKKELIGILVDELEGVNLYDKNTMTKTKNSLLETKTGYVKYLTKTGEGSTNGLFSVLDPDIIFEKIKKN